MTGASPMVVPVMAALRQVLPADRIVTDPDVLGAVSHDEAEWAPAGQPAVRARSEAEVQHIVRVCARLGVPVVPRGTA